MTFMRMEVVVPIGVGCYEYRYCVLVVFGNKFCLVEGLLDVSLCMRVGIPISYSFMLECCPY